jgi:ABC-2 type transport system ATP-binding protein
VPDYRDRKVEELSKGNQQKIQFIAAILHDPDVLIMDEPFSGLDPVNRRLLRQLIDEQHRAGRTIIFSTHAMYEAEQLCDHLVMINRGRKVLDLAMDEIFRRYDPHTVAVEPLDPNQRLKGVLSGVPGVTSLIEHDAGVDLKLADETDPAAVIDAVTRLARVRRVELKRPSIDDIFIDLVEKSGTSQDEIQKIRSEVQATHAEAAAAGVARG